MSDLSRPYSAPKILKFTIKVHGWYDEADVYTSTENVRNKLMHPRVGLTFDQWFYIPPPDSNGEVAFDTVKNTCSAIWFRPWKCNLP